MSASSATYVHAAAPRATRDRELLIVASVLTVGVVVTILDVTIAGEATKALARNIESKPSTIRWVATAYALALGSLLPLAVGRTVGDKAPAPRLDHFRPARVDRVGSWRGNGSPS